MDKPSVFRLPSSFGTIYRICLMAVFGLFISSHFALAAPGGAIKAPMCNPIKTCDYTAQPMDWPSRGSGNEHRIAISVPGWKFSVADKGEGIAQAWGTFSVFTLNYRDYSLGVSLEELSQLKAVKTCSADKANITRIFEILFSNTPESAKGLQGCERELADFAFAIKGGGVFSGAKDAKAMTFGEWRAYVFSTGSSVFKQAAIVTHTKFPHRYLKLVSKSEITSELMNIISTMELD